MFYGFLECNFFFDKWAILCLWLKFGYLPVVCDSISSSSFLFLLL